MCTGKEWLSKLLDDVRQKNERVQKLRDNGEKAIDGLREAVEKDIKFINREIYLHDDALEIFSAMEFTFGVSNKNIREVANVTLSPEGEVLHLSAPGKRQQYFSAESDEAGGVYFEDTRGAPVSVEELSRKIVEPLVRAEYGLGE